MIAVPAPWALAIVTTLLVAHPVARPETPEDRDLSFAHESGCFDGGFGCLLPK